MTPTCKRCKAPILWKKRPLGKWFPIDPQPVENGNMCIVGPLAVYVSKEKQENLKADKVPLYTSHLNTCPEKKPQPKEN
jgi:hypothetical protein